MLLYNIFFYKIIVDDSMKKIVVCLLFLFPFIINAKDVTNEVSILLNDSKINSKLIDNNEGTYIKIEKDSVISIESLSNIYGIYIVYEYQSKPGIITGNSKTSSIGENNFLHEFVSINDKLGETNNLTIKYEEDVKIADIYVFDDENLPDYVEIWQEPCKKADIMLISTHSDDEHLFFLGLLPTYVARGADVQVVYFTNHYNNTKRLHEQLHGLYTVGIRNYPIIGIVPDAWASTLPAALSNAKKSDLEEEDLISYIVDIIRRFKPQVIVDHDENGEYEHGQHMLNTYILEKALLKTNDESYNADSYKQYGGWEALKVYLHLYPENKIIMNYDIPLDYFNGKTAYEVSKEGYLKHSSQQYTWFTKWINGKNNSFTKATDIKTYSPNEFGLYSSLVGDDINKDDMLENITLRKDIKNEIQEEPQNIIKNISTKTSFNYYWVAVPIVLLILISLLKKKH